MADVSSISCRVALNGVIGLGTILVSGWGSCGAVTTRLHLWGMIVDAALWEIGALLPKTDKAWGAVWSRCFEYSVVVIAYSVVSDAVAKGGSCVGEVSDVE